MVAAQPPKVTLTARSLGNPAEPDSLNGYVGNTGSLLFIIQKTDSCPDRLECLPG